ncbi:hypothetical protein AVEN_29163-1 [Araneus ventricosus]|uniref:RNase H type-1 domain-containing protein n=1 Tax=Araneus ventricosus TaxID=182803 RepID=A0A4Y2AKL4_ARAVE|nr:hypothetical protein AVEN_29163-1 [Araneus ventricosus]
MEWYRPCLSPPAPRSASVSISWFSRAFLRSHVRSRKRPNALCCSNLQRIVEKALLYGAAVWGGALANAQILKLHSSQRMFLKLSRYYKTTPTNALNVILGIPPLHVIIKSLVTRFNIWKLRLHRHIGLTDPLKLDFYRDIKDIPSNEKNVILEKDFVCDYVVYTDGSTIDGNVGFSVCIFERNSLLPVHCHKLNIFNSVFQVELAAIYFAAG